MSTAQLTGLKIRFGGICMMNENVLKLLKNSMWDLATCADGEPNVVPVAFKDVTEDGKLVVVTGPNGGGKTMAGSPFPHTTRRTWKATRSRELRSTFPRGLSLTILRLWLKRCLTERPQQREL